MSKVLLFIIILTVCTVIESESARILAVFSTPSISHQVVFRPLIQELVKQGHEVIVVTTDPVFPKGQAPANLTEIDVHDISYECWQKTFVALATGKSEDLQAQVKVAVSTILKVFNMQLKTSEFKKIVDEKQQFDLLLLEAWIRPMLVLSHIFKAPVIQMSSFGREWHTCETVGAPAHPLLYPLCVHHRLYNLTLWDKVNRLYDEWKYKMMTIDIEKVNNDWIKSTFGPDTPSLNELSNNVDMVFLNIHPIWESNTPIPPAIIHTWGLHHKPEKPLPADLKTYLDNSKNGAIYMSFGTNTDPANLPPERIQMFIRVFSKLPYNILWKWNQDVLPGQTDNIRISKWFPQTDLLRNPKIKLFITQGGLQSTDEAILAGVPLIGIPMSGDQWYNTEKYVHHGIGIKLNIETVTERELKEAIDEVIENEWYHDNIKKLGGLFRDQPQTALDRTVWWVEYVMRHGGARNLQAPAANISWAKYLDIELVAVLLISCLITVSLITFVFIHLYKFLKQNLFHGRQTKKL